MAKVVLLCGSPRPQGNTAQLLGLCKQELENLGLEAEVISLAGKQIQSCIACYKCGQLGKCALKDDLNDIIDTMRNAQGFIVGAPVYFGTARGDVMSALQRIGMVSRSTDKFLSWQVGGPIAVCRRGGSTVSLQEMLMFFFINEMIVPGSTYWNIAFGGKTPGEVLQDTEGVQTIQRFAQNVGKLIQRL